MPTIRVLLLIMCSVCCGYAGKFNDASSYSNQFHGDYESHELHSSEYEHDSNHNSNDYHRHHNNHHGYKHEMRHPSAAYFYPKERIWHSYSMPPHKRVESNEISYHDEEQEAPVFSYDHNDPYGPSNWGKLSQQCDGNYQSPIALHSHNATVNRNSSPFTIEGLDAKPSSLKVENNGHSLKISFNYPNGKRVRVFGGPLQIPFILDNIHWHWGKSDKGGSEHTMNSNRFSAEMHMVTYNSNYDSYAAASTQPKGLAVIGILYALDNLNYIKRANNPWTSLSSKVIEPKTSYTETKNLFTLRDIVQHEKFGILSYRGSLTTPNCTENVMWLVSTRHLSISTSELAELRKIKDEKGERLLQNFRPLQDLNSRAVTLYI